MIRPINDWLVVKLDPLEDRMLGDIILLADSSANIIRTGVVVACGPGRYATGSSKRAPICVDVGEKVAFLRWHLEHKTGKQVMSFLEGVGEDLALIRSTDVLIAYTGDVQVG